MEEYRDVKGYEGLYQISNLKNIKGRKGNTLKIYPVSGRLTITLHNNGLKKTRMVEHLFNESFPELCVKPYIKTDKGIYFHKGRQRFIAQIYHNGKQKYLGSYICSKMASEVYQKKLKEVRELC